MAENNKYLDLGGLKYFKNNYIQNIYLVPFNDTTNTNLQFGINNTAASQEDDIWFSGSIAIEDSVKEKDIEKINYSYDEAKVGDLLYVKEKKTAYIVYKLTNDDNRIVVAKAIAGGGLKDVTYEDDELTFYLTNEDDPITVKISDLATLRASLADLNNRAVSSEGQSGFSSGEIVAGTGNNRNITGTGITVDDLVTIANGQTKTYVIDINGKQEGSGQNYIVNSRFDSTDESIIIEKVTDSSSDYYLWLIDSTIENPNIINLDDLQVGDTVLLTNKDKPDRWVSSTTNSVVIFSILETRKIDLDEYLKTPDEAITSDNTVLGINTSGNTKTYSFTGEQTTFTEANATITIPSVHTIQSVLFNDYYTQTYINKTFATTASLDDYLTITSAKNTYVAKTYSYQFSDAVRDSQIGYDTPGTIILQVSDKNTSPTITNPDSQGKLSITPYSFSFGITSSPSAISQVGLLFSNNQFFKYFVNNATVETRYEILDTSMAILTAEIDDMFGVKSE